MANVRLKNIQFPGLDNTYTIPDEAPAYSTSGTYAVGDMVIYDGKLYKCTTAITTAEAWTAAHWSETKMGNEVSELKTAIADYGITNPLGDVISSLSAATLYSVKFTPKSGNIINVDGTTDTINNSGYKLIDLSNSIPDWIEKGKKYTASINTTIVGLSISVYYYDTSNTLKTLLRLEYPYIVGNFTVPLDAKGFRITLFAVKGGYVINNVDVKIDLRANKSLDTLDALASQNNISELFADNCMTDINHRGFSQYLPENSLPAFEMSSNFGYRFVECDLQKCSNGYVVIHDSNTNRVTGISKDVATATLSELTAMTLTIYNSSGIDAKIPSLAQALDCFKKNKLIPIIELKEDTISESDIPTILETLNIWGGKYIITSLAHGIRSDGNTHKLLLETARNYSPNVPIIVLLWETCTNDTIDLVLNTFGENTAIQVREETNPTKALVEYAHSKNILFGAYAPATYPRYNEMIELGMDMCTTNYLMNNHSVATECELIRLPNGELSSNTIQITNGTGNTDILWVRGYVKCNGKAIISQNDLSYNTHTVNCNGNFVYVNFQIWLRGSNAIEMSITPETEGDTITTKWLSMMLMKCTR